MNLTIKNQYSNPGLPLVFKGVPQSDSAINPQLPAQIIPELGGIGYNIKFGNWRYGILSAPVEIRSESGEVAPYDFMIETGTGDCFFTQLAGRDPNKVAKFVHDNIWREKLIKPKTEKPILTYKYDGEPESINESVTVAKRQLIESRFPSLARALKTNQRGKKLIQAFICDAAAICQDAPAVTDWNLVMDASFAKTLGDSLRKKAKIVSPFDWHLVENWIPAGYFALKSADRLQAVKKNFPSAPDISANSLDKKCRRLGLISDIRTGKPELHPFLQ